VQGTLRKQEGTSQVWGGPLAGGALAAVLLNTADSGTASITLDAATLGVTAGSSSWRIRDVWRNATLAQQTLPITLPVGAHDAAFLVLHPLRPSL